MMTNKEILSKIQMMLFWNHDEERWIVDGEDPGWDPFNLLSEIADLMQENGYGTKHS